MIIYNRSNIAFRKVTIILSLLDLLKLICGLVIKVDGNYELRFWGR